jgi:PelA/Pel-15E family pectate lyase
MPSLATSCRPALLHAVMLLFALSVSGKLSAQDTAGIHFKNPDAWFAGPEAKKIADNILSYQSDYGGWPKNTDTTAKPYTGNRADLKPTFDNKATTDELRFLARMFGATKEKQYRQSVEKGVDYILKAQYPTGGWPQFYPPGKQYHRHITFNDDAMVRLMVFLRETYTSDRFAFLDTPRKDAARAAFSRGIQCILKCQIRVNGKLTAWCAQHDEIDYSPRPGRAFELTSLSGSESVGITRLLMSLEQPAPDVVTAVESALEWFRAAAIKGMRVDEVPDPQSPKGKDRRVLEDPSAPLIWARFYEIGTNQPIFCDRDGVAKHKLSEIGYERRNGYRWLNNWPQSLLDHDYPAWKKPLPGKKGK